MTFREAGSYSVKGKERKVPLPYSSLFKLILVVGERVLPLLLHKRTLRGREIQW